jgi:hypothetical protein
MTDAEQTIVKAGSPSPGSLAGLSRSEKRE